MASQTDVYKLEPRPYDQQVAQFVQGKHFELALQIAVSAANGPLSSGVNSEH